MMNKTTNLIIAAVLLCLPVFAQESNRPLGWDLTYSTILETNKIGPKTWIRKWLASGYQSPAKKWISERKGEPIVSSILLEFPSSNTAEHTTIWIFRTKTHAYYRQDIENVKFSNNKKDLKLEVYDNLLTLVSSWQQAKPVEPENTPAGGDPGYIGFLSLYDKVKSRQMLLSLRDFIMCDTKKCKGTKVGRLFAALIPVIPKPETN